jgi:hypothetical protein
LILFSFFVLLSFFFPMKAPHWDWTVTPPFSFLVEDAAVASLEVSVFNEKAWISKQITGNGLMGTVHLSLPRDILSRKDSRVPTQSWHRVTMPEEPVLSKKNTKKNTKQKHKQHPMVLVETWFEEEQHAPKVRITSTL